MTAPETDSRSEAESDRSLLAGVFGRNLPLETETSWFILVSVLDVLMTTLLLWRGQGAYEANPIARWFLEGWGLKGLVFFKFAMVAFIGIVTQMIAVRRVDLARRILRLGTIVVGLVVVYSLGLYLLR